MKTPDQWAAEYRAARAYFREHPDAPNNLVDPEELVAAVQRDAIESFAAKCVGDLKRECDVSTRNAEKDRRHNMATLAYAHALRIVEALAKGGK